MRSGRRWVGAGGVGPVGRVCVAPPESLYSREKGGKGCTDSEKLRR